MMSLVGNYWKSVLKLLIKYELLKLLEIESKAISQTVIDYEMRLKEAFKKIMLKK